MSENLKAETGSNLPTAQDKLWLPEDLEKKDKNWLVLFTKKIGATLLLLVLILCPFIILGGVILFFYIFAKFPGFASVALGVLSISILGYVEKQLPFTSITTTIWTFFLAVWHKAFYPIVTTILVLIPAILVSYLFFPYAYYGLFDHYTGRGRISLTDSLEETRSDFRWQINNGCSLSSDGLQVSDDSENTFYYCMAQAAPRYTNFIFEVQMTIVTGDCGALLFRAYPARDTTYYYRLCSNGSFELIRYDTGSKSGSFSSAECSLIKGIQSSDCILFSGNASDIIRNKQHQPVYPITLAVMADGVSIDLYANDQHLGGYDDLPNQAYLQGLIGVAANSVQDFPTIVRFTNVRVWQL